VKREKGKIDVLFASEGIVDPVLLLTRDEEQETHAVDPQHQ